MIISGNVCILAKKERQVHINMSVNKYTKKVKVKGQYKEVTMWEVYLRYKDFSGEKHKKHKRGFSQKKDALTWEKEFLQRVQGSTEMTFNDLYKKYIAYYVPNGAQNIRKIKATSLENKIEIFELHILPYFKNRVISSITPLDILDWHNKLGTIVSKQGQPLSTAYLKKIHGQLSGIFNFAIRFYNLKNNPAQIAGNFEKDTRIQKIDMLTGKWWDISQYQQFAEAAMDDDIYYHLFETVFWNGLRIGEALALRKKDFDFKNSNLYIVGNASGKKVKRNENGELEFTNAITTPKNGETRTIKMFPSYAEEMEDYISRIYDLKDNDVVFPVCKKNAQNHWKSIWKKTNLPYMKLHGCRHSHASILFSLGFNVIQIAQRLGHKETTITYMYADLLKSDEQDMINKLEKARLGVM